MGWSKEMQERYPEGWRIALAKMRKSAKEKPPMLGRTQSEYQRLRSREANLGNTHRAGKPKSAEERAKISASSMGKKGTRNGVIESEETRAKKSASIKAALARRTKEQRDSWVAKIKVKRAKQVLPLKDTLPERLLQEELMRRGIAFRKHEPIDGLPDIFIEPNLCVFADGNYWHSRPEAIVRDRATNAILRRRGYFVIRFWEKDIKADVKKCVDYLVSRI